MRHENTNGCSTHNTDFESRILQEIEKLGSCTLDELVQAIQDYTWVQVFIMVDRLSRNGAVILRHPTPFEYVVEIGTRLMLRHPTSSEYLIEAEMRPAAEA